MVHTTVFKSNRSQAVRLPKDVAFSADVKEVEVIKVGKSRIITPVGTVWDDWFDGVGVSDDFMEIREQPATQQREEL